MVSLVSPAFGPLGGILSGLSGIEELRFGLSATLVPASGVAPKVSLSTAGPLPDLIVE